MATGENKPGLEDSIASVVESWRGKTLLIMGQVGVGKTNLARLLAEQLEPSRGKTAIVSSDLGQSPVGVPTCLSLVTAPWERPSAYWFAGDVTVSGNLLPVVVGTLRLVERARSEGAALVVIDTCGHTKGTAARICRYHQALAAGVDGLVTIERQSELKEMSSVLGGIVPQIFRFATTPLAKDRDLEERRVFRQSRYEVHFRGGRVYRLDPAVFLDLDWVPGAGDSSQTPLTNRVAGLIDAQGFCLGLGIVEDWKPDQVTVYTAVRNLGAAVRVQLGKLRLDREAGFLETRDPPYVLASALGQPTATTE